MKKIYFALGHIALENYIKKELSKEYLFIGGTVYKEGIMKGIVKKSPDIIVIRETLDGKEDILTILYEIRNNFPDIRIILLAGQREVGDNFLYKIVSIGIWDVLYGDSIQTKEIISLIRNKNSYKNIKHLQNINNVNDDNNIIENLKNDISDNFNNKDIELKKEGMVKEKENIEKENNSNKSNDEVNDKDKNIISFFNSFNKKINKPNFGPSPSVIANSKKIKLHHEIISFLGAKTGTGNTTLAYNTATLLAQSGYKTMFVELDDLSPSVAYWLNIGKTENGIESAIKGLKNNKLKKIDEAIIKTIDLQNKKNSDMIDVYKKLPINLDFLFFSDKFLDRFKDSETIDIYDLNLFKDLILNLVFQKNYDIVVLDISAKNSNELKKNCLMYSNKLFISLTQDIATFGYGENEIEYYKKNNIDLVKDPTYILNKFTNAKFKYKHVEQWLNSKNIVYIPDNFSKMIDSNFIGLPIVLNDKNSKLSNSIKGIINKI